MIGFLQGTLRRKEPDGILLDVQGVGYQLQVPLSTFYTLGEPGAATALQVHTVVREDEIALYGFATDREKTLFQRLLGVSGIGPRIALAILSGIGPDELILAVGQGSVARVQSIPGIGKKTAERLCLELRDKLPEPAAATAVEAGLRGDLVSALVNLGYRAPVVEKLVDRLLRERSDWTLETAIKAALIQLAR